MELRRWLKLCLLLVCLLPVVWCGCRAYVRNRYTHRFLDACKGERYAAAACLIDNVDQGNVDVQFEIAKMYYKGNGLDRDEFKARGWLERAVANGSELAMVALGGLYEKGSEAVGGKIYLKTALKLYLKAAEKGNGLAATRIGEIYHDGKGVEKDYGTALAYFRKGMDNGCLDAAVAVLWMYRCRECEIKDALSAVAFVKKEAEMGNAKAMRYMGKFNAKGVPGCVEKNGKEALKWYRRAVLAGDETSADLLVEEVERAESHGAG